MCGTKMQWHLNGELFLQVIALQVPPKNTDNIYNLQECYYLTHKSRVRH